MFSLSVGYVPFIQERPKVVFNPNSSKDSITTESYGKSISWHNPAHLYYLQFYYGELILNGPKRETLIKISFYIVKEIKNSYVFRWDPTSGLKVFFVFLSWLHNQLLSSYYSVPFFTLNHY